MRLRQSPCQKYGGKLGVHRLDLCDEGIVWSNDRCVWDQRRSQVHDGGGGAVALDFCYYVLLFRVLLWGESDGKEEEEQGGAGWNVG